MPKSLNSPSPKSKSYDHHLTHKLTILLTLKAKVRAECYNDPTLMSGYTPYLDTYLEPIPTPEYECGKVFPDREITNKELKHTFVPGEIVESKNGDTRYEIMRTMLNLDSKDNHL